MKGALPPSSSATRFTPSAAWRISNLPTAVEPVKPIILTSGAPVITGPSVWASPQITLNTPSGMPARRASSASARAESGVSGAGLITMVHPAARAGAHLRVIIALGKFHGVMQATTPTGW